MSLEQDLRHLWFKFHKDSGHKHTGAEGDAPIIFGLKEKTPASASAAGTKGEICWDASYIYICVATNTWKRASISTWV